MYLKHRSHTNSLTSVGGSSFCFSRSSRSRSSLAFLASSLCCRCVKYPSPCAFGEDASLPAARRAARSAARFALTVSPGGFGRNRPRLPRLVGTGGVG